LGATPKKAEVFWVRQAPHPAAVNGPLVYLRAKLDPAKGIEECLGGETLRVCFGADHHLHPGDDRIAGVFVAIDLSGRCIETLKEVDQHIAVDDRFHRSHSSRSWRTIALLSSFFAPGAERPGSIRPVLLREQSCDCSPHRFGSGNASMDRHVRPNATRRPGGGKSLLAGARIRRRMRRLATPQTLGVFGVA